MFITYQILNAILCIFLAKKDAEKILTDKPVNHFANGVIHISVAALAWYLYSINIFFAVLVGSKLVFDITLNFFRNFNLFYIPSKPKSIADKIERLIFSNNGVIPKLFYLAIVIILNVWQ